MRAKKTVATKKTAKPAAKAKTTNGSGRKRASDDTVIMKLANSKSEDYNEKVQKGSFAEKIWNAVTASGITIAALAKKTNDKRNVAYVNWHVNNGRMKKATA